MSEIHGESSVKSDKQICSKKIEIDIERLKNMGFITSLQSNTLLSEELREIKRPLLRNIKKKKKDFEKTNMIQVTSSLPGEGKTFTSINLAMTIAMEFDYTVLLVDADVIKSSVSQALDIHEEYGLTDYLNRDVKNLSDVLLNTSIPKLSLLPAGTRQSLSTELLNSEFMDELINELATRYDDRIVIIDSPPLLATNESRVLAHKVGQIVFVVEHNKTTQTNIKSALSLLDPDMNIGMILNKNRNARGQYGYYGYYGYGSHEDD
ncbi:MAG: XrtA-associated tyrosine autokinase [Gammaproteobacteria bacterium]|nr:XrtA-associated tyrosine autokinase [Gammaproteobacteria bacterium]